jgi:flagellar basal body rod protein FlgG
MNVSLYPAAAAMNANARWQEVIAENLAGNTALTEQQKIAEVSRLFEAILLRQILDSTQKPM